MHQSETLPPANRVTVVDVDIQFGSMVWLMLKSSFAAAIAALVTRFLWATIGVLTGGMMMLGFMALMMLFAALGLGMAGVGTPVPPGP